VGWRDFPLNLVGGEANTVFGFHGRMGRQRHDSRKKSVANKDQRIVDRRVLDWSEVRGCLDLAN
jgi:hypothetical protein